MLSTRLAVLLGVAGCALLINGENHTAAKDNTTTGTAQKLVVLEETLGLLGDSIAVLGETVINATLAQEALALNARLQSDGTPDKAGGPAWNPLRRIKAIGDHGADAVMISFPPPVELHTNHHVPLYECTFTRIVDGAPSKDPKYAVVRMRPAVLASTLCRKLSGNVGTRCGVVARWRAHGAAHPRRKPLLLATCALAVRAARLPHRPTFAARHVRLCAALLPQPMPVPAGTPRRRVS